MRRASFGSYLTIAVLLTVSVGLYGATHRLQTEGDATAAPAPVRSLAALHADVGDASLHALANARLDERLERDPDDHEAQLLKALVQFKSGRLDEAENALSELTRRAPRFHLAHVVHGDVRLVRARSVTDIGDGILQLGLMPASGTEVAALRAEAEVRLKAYLDALPQGRVPRAVLELGESVRTALVVDKAHHRLYVYERRNPGEPPRLVKDYYVSLGKATGDKMLSGDLRTPEGVYFVTRYIPGEALPARYGTRAYPINYPNELDARARKTGHGIWLHGVDDIYYSRPPQDSDGCVALPNEDIDRLADFIDPGTTPVVIAQRIDWVDERDWSAERAGLMQAVQAWADDWASGDVEAYLAHYARDFGSPTAGFRQWAARKRALAAGKTFQEIDLSDLSLFRYPSSSTVEQGRELAVAVFRQAYRSNNFSSDSRKRLYLVREDGRWRVLYEGTVR